MAAPASQREAPNTAARSIQRCRSSKPVKCVGCPFGTGQFEYQSCDNRRANFLSSLRDADRLRKSSARRMYFSSRRDSTIVAWHEVPGKRPPKEPSRRVRYDRTQLIPEVFLVESASRRTTPIVAWHEMPDDVRAAVRCDGIVSSNTWISSVLTSETWSLQFFNHRIEVRTPARIRPYPTGRLLGVAMSQALRARLRSHCPSGVCRTLVILKKATL